MKYNERAWAGFICVGTGTSRGSCDLHNEPLDSTQCRNFLPGSGTISFPGMTLLHSANSLYFFTVHKGPNGLCE